MDISNMIKSYLETKQQEIIDNTIEEISDDIINDLRVEIQKAYKDKFDELFDSLNSNISDFLDSQIRVKEVDFSINSINYNLVVTNKKGRTKTFENEMSMN